LKEESKRKEETTAREEHYNFRLSRDSVFLDLENSSLWWLFPRKLRGRDRILSKDAGLAVGKDITRMLHWLRFSLCTWDCKGRRDLLLPPLFLWQRLLRIREMFGCNPNYVIDKVRRGAWVLSCCCRSCCCKDCLRSGVGRIKTKRTKEIISSENSFSLCTCRHENMKRVRFESTSLFGWKH
jgi:hypothetical protein